MELTTNGAKAEESRERANMAEHSKTYQKKGKRPMKRTVEFSQKDALQILQQSFLMCQLAGVNILVQNTEQGTVITLENIETLDGWLVPRENASQNEDVPL